jgi:hypothetical protein
VKATLSIVDDKGNKYRGYIDLLPVQSISEDDKENVEPGGAAHDEIAFGLPIRAFVSRYASGGSGGAAKFTILLAFLTKGSVTADVSADALKSEWSRLTAHLGAFNRAHSTRAKDRAWVDSPAQGAYRLGPLWREAFDQQ